MGYQVATTCRLPSGLSQVSRTLHSLAAEVEVQEEDEWSSTYMHNGALDVKCKHCRCCAHD
jgi:hypothetical protein